MKIKNQKKSKKALFISLAVLIIILAGIATYVLLTKKNPQTETSTNNVVNTAQDSNNTDSSSDSYKETPTTDDSTTTSDNIPASTAGSLKITKLVQEGDYISALAVATDFQSTQCVYTFTSENSKPVVRQTTGSCTEVTIPAGEFDKIGTYTLTVVVYDGTNKLTESKDIYVQ